MVVLVRTREEATEELVAGPDDNAGCGPVLTEKRGNCWKRGKD